MTSPWPEQVRSHPDPRPVRRLAALTRSVSVRLSLSGAIAVGLLAGLTGCGSEPEPEPVVVTPKAAPPPVVDARPKVKTVQQLMDELGIDDRIIWQEENAPHSTEERVAILEFFDAWARGDDGDVRSSISSEDKPLLAIMVDEGLWDEATESIEEIELFSGTGPAGNKAVFAAYVRDAEDEAQLWYYDGERADFTFQAVATPPAMMSRLSGDGQGQIEQWHTILAAELALALTPDVEVVLPTEEEEEEDYSGGGGLGMSKGPGRGGGRGGQPNRPKRRPPGPG